MIARVWFASALLPLLSSCVGTSQSSTTPANKPPVASSTNPPSGDCSSMRIQSKEQFESCNKKCNDDGREQSRQCSNPECQQGIGQGTRICLGKCESDQIAAKKAACYHE